MNHKAILQRSTDLLKHLEGHSLEGLSIDKPLDLEYAKHLFKIVSKLSPIYGNMIEFLIVRELNKIDWKGLGKWKRQDPGFPDALFDGSITPKPGIEIKTWFPLATEMTARFKDSILHFEHDQVNVVIVAWLPEHIIYGTPKIVGVWVGPAKSLAIARDLHYHNPPDYLVFEPEDTSARTINLQQTNTNGYKFQGSAQLLEEAKKEVASWSGTGTVYDPSPDYQRKLRSLLAKYPYRLDTNFAKIDRIMHNEIELFKTKVLNTVINQHPIGEWSKICEDESVLNELIQDLI